MLYVLVVIYNKECKNSKTIKSLLRYTSYKMLNVIIFDNSTSDFHNMSFCRDNNFSYYGFKKNLGLSTAYNYVIDRIGKDDGYVIILDDDTELTTDYLTEVVARTQDVNNVEVLLPIVKADNGILSPCMIKYGSGAKSIQKIEDIDMNRITAINSGMVVNLQVYKSIRYDENLFLDCVDHDFMRAVKARGVPIRILKSAIYQSFSRNEKQKKENALHRFNIFSKDFELYSQRCNSMLYYYCSITKLLLNYTIHYKTKDFLVAFLRRNCKK